MCTNNDKSIKIDAFPSSSFPKASERILVDITADIYEFIQREPGIERRKIQISTIQTKS